jgi:hypothetical protein
MIAHVSVQSRLAGTATMQQDTWQPMAKTLSSKLAAARTGCDIRAKCDAVKETNFLWQKCCVSSDEIYGLAQPAVSRRPLRPPSERKRARGTTATTAPSLTAHILSVTFQATDFMLLRWT